MNITVKTAKCHRGCCSTYRCERTVSIGQSFKTDRELDITGTDNVLNLKVRELCREAQLLNDTGVLARRQLGIILRLCTSNDHLSRSKDKSRGLWFTNSHDHSGETLHVAPLFGTNKASVRRVRVCMGKRVKEGLTKRQQLSKQSSSLVSSTLVIVQTGLQEVDKEAFDVPLDYTLHYERAVQCSSDPSDNPS